MSDLKLPSDPKKPDVSFARVAIWVVVGAVALYMIASGVIGILSK